MIFLPGDHVYVDESKARAYILVATAVSAADRVEVEKVLRALRKPGQRRIHFNSESDSRRREILARLVQLPIRCHIWEVKGFVDELARTLCLEDLVREISAAGAAHLIVETDESLVRHDRSVIAAILRKESNPRLAYRHSTPHGEPLLWVSDAVAWCRARRGDWIRRSDPIVASISVRRV